MNIAFFIAHPSQYYMFKYIIAELSKKHHVIAIYFEKDILTKLIESDPFDVETFYIKSTAKNNMFGLLKNVWIKEYQLLKIGKYHHIDVFIGSSVVIAHVARLMGSKSIIFTEDDVNVIHLSAKIGYPFCNHIVSPKVCNLGRWEYKAIKYNGYQKLTYLHPRIFDAEKIHNIEGIKSDEKFFLLRFSNLSAHHDIGIKGINNSLAKTIIQTLLPHGKVYISSERNLPDDLEPYRLEINPVEIHHVLLQSQLLISDSQSMSVEAAILGIPSIRFSDFAVKISVLEELEHDYGLTYGVKTDQPKVLIKRIKELLKISDLKSEFQKRKMKMLADKIDVNSFLVNLIDNYPPEGDFKIE